METNKNFKQWVYEKIEKMKEKSLFKTKSICITHFKLECKKLEEELSIAMTAFKETCSSYTRYKALLQI